MSLAVRIVSGAYRDSVALMQLSAELAALPGIRRASLVMATPANLALLAEAGLLERPLEAAPNDLVIALEGRALEAAFEQAMRALGERRERTAPGLTVLPKSLAQARAAAPQANLALISVPGEYAAAEARKALRLGLNAMLFSDNVALEEEAALKREAAERGLLLLGPDCGTAIVDGLRLGFANHVRAGPIGCIGASGTGLQEVTSLVERLGQGVSQAIGVGGRDLHEAVGGLATLAALERLAADRDTRVIVLISKPPAASVAERVLAAAAKLRKPVVTCFVGSSKTLEDAAYEAVALARKRKPAARAFRPGPLPRIAAPRRYVRGLFSGGTFCHEAARLLEAALGPVSSNPIKSRGHSVIDLGDDVFTRGRPHPMIDPRLRIERIAAEAADREVAVLLLDVVLGDGAHPDPAGALAPALKAAAKRRIAVVASVCGTEADPQVRSQQVKRLKQAGVRVAESNAQAARLAAAIARRAGGAR
jgi:succinyl-CoA synthetase alpha subunit